MVIGGVSIPISNLSRTRSQWITLYDNVRNKAAEVLLILRAGDTGTPSPTFSAISERSKSSAMERKGSQPLTSRPSTDNFQRSSGLNPGHDKAKAASTLSTEHHDPAAVKGSAVPELSESTSSPPGDSSLPHLNGFNHSAAAATPTHPENESASASAQDSPSQHSEQQDSQGAKFGAGMAHMAPNDSTPSSNRVGHASSHRLSETDLADMEATSLAGRSQQDHESDQLENERSSREARQQTNAQPAPKYPNSVQGGSNDRLQHQKQQQRQQKKVSQKHSQVSLPLAILGAGLSAAVAFMAGRGAHSGSPYHKVKAGDAVCTIGLCSQEHMQEFMAQQSSHLAREGRLSIGDRLLAQ